MIHYKLLVGALLMLVIRLTSAQSSYQVSGFVKDSKSGEVLIGATITDCIGGKGTITDYNGFFYFRSREPVRLRVSYVGYTQKEIEINEVVDSLLIIFLEPGDQLEEIVVRAESRQKLNMVSLSNRELQQIPSLGGKPDVSKSLQLLPGISTQNEGSSRLLVRGGDPGTNLYLFDNIPILHVYHLGGFISVFNPDIINNIDVYKGAFPARYGGKLSAVVDITQKEGDISELRGSFAIGVTDASFHIEGPLRLTNTSFIITGRKTMVDGIIAFITHQGDGNDFILTYGFHDLNGKFTWKPNTWNTLSINLYQGDDYLTYWGKKQSNTDIEKYRFVNSWGNLLASSTWDRSFPSGLFMSTSLAYTQYRLKDKRSYLFYQQDQKEDYEEQFLSAVRAWMSQFGLKYPLFHFWEVSSGIHSSMNLHTPGYILRSDQNKSSVQEVIPNYETSLYLDNNIEIGGQLDLKPGFRAVFYSNNGYKFCAVEPRASLKWDIGKQQELNLGYSRINQYAHLLSISGPIMQNEIWLPANEEIPSSYASEFSMGWNGGFWENKVTSSLVLYYKQMGQLIAFKEGYSTIRGDTDWYPKLASEGEGEAIGLECIIRKKYGKITGFAAYSWSRITRQFPEINGGRTYVFEYDRPHNISINLNFALSSNLSLNAVWVYQTGLPYTPVLGRQYTMSTEPMYGEGYFYYEAFIYGERNSERMKDYHRLDIGVNWSRINRRNRKVIWNFSIYNVYNRHNPYYYYFNTNNSGEIYHPEYGEPFKPFKLYQLSFFPIIPSISYKVFFDRSEHEKKSFKKRIKNWLYYEE